MSVCCRQWGMWGIPTPGPLPHPSSLLRACVRACTCMRVCVAQPCPPPPTHLMCVSWCENVVWAVGFARHLHPLLAFLQQQPYGLHRKTWEVLILPSSIPSSARSNSTAQHSTAQHSTAQHSTAQHSTAQHSTAQHSTAQHSTAQHTGIMTAWR